MWDDERETPRANFFLRSFLHVILERLCNLLAPWKAVVARFYRTRQAHPKIDCFAFSETNSKDMCARNVSLKPRQLLSGHARRDLSLLALALFENIHRHETRVSMHPEKSRTLHVLWSVQGHLEMLSKGRLVMRNQVRLRALPRIVAHLVISSQVRGIVEEIELHSLKLENMLARRAVAELPEGR